MLEHVRRFTGAATRPTQYERPLTLPALAAIAAALAAVGVAYRVQHNVPEPAPVRVLERSARYGPLALGIHVGIALLVAAALGLLFAPSLRVAPDTLGSALLVMEAVAGLSILLGIATRAGAAAPRAVSAHRAQPRRRDPGRALHLGRRQRGARDRRGHHVGEVTRPVMAAGAAIFTGTLFVFGWPELLGHLPLYGIMLLLLIAPNADTWRVRRALRPGA